MGVPRTEERKAKSEGRNKTKTTAKTIAPSRRFLVFVVVVSVFGLRYFVACSNAPTT